MNLNKSGFNDNLQYTPRSPTRIKGQRNITWLEPPVSENLKTNVGLTFLGVLEKKTFLVIPNTTSYLIKNNVKITYSCMSPMGIVTSMRAYWKTLNLLRSNHVAVLKNLNSHYKRKFCHNALRMTQLLTNQ